jgi:ABC-type antimicrobial peptide transport system permease subunit
MPLNSLRHSFRSLLKNKVITCINVLGLSIGISAALVIYLIVQYDYSFDRYEPSRDRMYRVATHGDNWDNAGVPVPLPRALAGISGIERSAFMIGMNDGGTKVSISQGNDKAPRVFRQQDRFIYADSNYFVIFPHQWLAGNPAVSLKDPHQIVLSESLARRYFGGLTDDGVIGKSMMVDDSIPMVVSGIVKDLTANTDFDQRAILSIATIAASQGLKDQVEWDQWGSTNSANQVMLVLSPDVKPADVTRQIMHVFKSHSGGQQDKSTISLQPLSDIHFNEKLEGKVSESTLLSLSLVAVFILLLGSINFINLLTAQASERAKEIGMRKILGSSNRQLIARYLSETALLTVISTVFSLLITPLIIKVFSDFMPEGLDAGRMLQPHVLAFLAILILIVSFLSGIYPSLVLTHIKPLSATRNSTLSMAGGNRRVWLRKTLTVSQFVIAQVFIIGVLVVNSQIHYAINTEMGFRKDAVMTFYCPFDWNHPSGKKNVLRDKLKNISGIEDVALGNGAPAIGGFMTTEVEFKEGKKDIRLPVDSRTGDTNYIGLYHIRILAGHNVLPTDSPSQFLINETLARDLGFQRPADAIGHMLGEGHPIVGVMADFHLASVRKPIHPTVFSFTSNWDFAMNVALDRSPDTWQPAIAKIQKAWEGIYPDQPFTYTFLDKDVANFYEREQRLSRLLTWAAGVAILISCLGLLGLVIFTANQRTREIGIRKVLGASVAQIIALLSKDFVRLVALAFLIAVPIAWYGANQWLQSFAYHAALKWWLFAIGGVAMLAISLLILSIRAGKAALSNPVDSLRTE